MSSSPPNASVDGALASDPGNVANADIDPVSVNNPPRQGMVLGKGDHHATVIVQHLHAYAKAVGFTQKFMADNKGPDGDERRLRVLCGHWGNPSPSVKVDNPNNQRNKQSKRVGCPYCVRIWKTNNRPGDHTCMAARTDNLAWVITSVKGIHHAPCSGLDHDDPHAFFQTAKIYFLTNHFLIMYEPRLSTT